MAEPVLVIDRLTVYNRTDPRVLFFGREQVLALQEVSLAVAPGECLALAGESGSGKSTLLRVVAGHQAPDGGRVLVAGRDVTGRKDPAVAWVPQEPRQALELERPFGDAVAAELAAARVASGGAARQRVQAALAEVGLGPEFLDREPARASGGQVQRMAVARALALAPRVLLLDEPVSGVDPHTAELVVRAIRKARLAGTAVVLATHDLRLIRRLAQRVALLREGRVVAEGPPAEVLDATT